MTLRGLPARIPPVLVTALLVHVAANRLDHAPGLEQAPALAALLTTVLALAGLTVFLAASMRTARSSIATKGSDAACVAVLGAGGLGLYLALELFEGHGLSIGLPALLACVPAALLVFRMARAAGALLEAAGVAFAAYARAPRVAAPDASAAPSGRLLGGTSLRAAGAHSGRAPPQLA
jgi:hypothetical protein